MKKLDVVFLSDINYIQYFAVALTSLLENNLHTINRIFLVHDIDDLGQLENILGFFKEKYNKKIELFAIDSTKMDGYTLTHQLTKATYFRLYFAELLPVEIEKVLFLDSDIIVKESITNLLDIDFNNTYSSTKEYYLYAVDHRFHQEEIARLRKMNFSGNKYFNAGVLLINLKKWRKDHVTPLFIATLKKYNEEILWADQDVLNLVFDNQWGELDYDYNAFGLPGKIDDDYKIIHYIGMSKPWHFKNRHPYRYLYWKYLELTPFKRRFSEDLSIYTIVELVIFDPMLHLLRSVKKKLMIMPYVNNLLKSTRKG